ncbi:MAG: hypothetical protein RLZ10_1445 [Bacteroidota bacterium]|jgi:superfamily II DNA or RNA helicase
MSEVRTGFVSNWFRTNVDVMQPKEIGFVHPPRKWQSECFEIIAPPTPIALINAPTGSGKSTMLSMLAYQRTLSDNKKKTIIAVPQTVIGKGFNTKVFKLPDGQVIDWSVGLDLCTKANDTVEQFTNFIKEDFFYSEAYPFERILVCTHSTLVAAFQSFSQEDKEKHWNNLLICVDETHHIQMHEITSEVYNMNSLGQMVDYSFRNNNEIILLSATMFRGDQKSLLSSEISKNAVRYNLPFDKYMEEMKHLKSFSYDFIIDTNEYTKDISKCIKNLFEDNLKKLFIYIPHPRSYLSSGNKIQEIQDILEQLKMNLDGENIFLDEKTGIYHITNSSGLDYKICDLVDPSLSRLTTRFVNDEAINIDKNALDCVIALNRAKEGFDWEYADGMIVVGQRNSLTDLIQMLGRLLRDKQGKEKVKTLHMLPFSPTQANDSKLDSPLNDFFKAIAISLLMEDVFSPSIINFNNDSTSIGYSTPFASINIFDELELDENLIADLFDTTQKSLINIAGGLVDSQGFYSPEELKEQMPLIIKQWIDKNNVEADQDQINQLIDKVYNQLAKRSLQMQGINVSNINWQMIESADPIEFILRYVGKDTTLESLKELRRLIAKGESESNAMCHKVCQRIKIYGLPRYGLGDYEENHHYVWLYNRRKAKQGKHSYAFYESDQKIATFYGLPNLFDSLDILQINLERTQYCIDYYIKYGKYPSDNSKDFEERKMASWLASQRYIKKNPYLNECLEYAISKGHPNLFERTDREKEMLEKIQNMFEWISNNRVPKRNSINEEKTYYNLIATLRSGKNGEPQSVWHDSYDNLFEKYDMWHLIHNRKEKSISKCKKLIDYCLLNKRTPLNTVPEEKKLYDYFKVKNKDNSWYPEELELLQKSNVRQYFLTLKEKTIFNYISDIEQIALFKINNNTNELPPQTTHAKELITLQICRRRFQENLLEKVIIDKFSELGLFHHLESNVRELQARQKFMELCDRLQKGSRPSKTSKCEEDAKLGRYMSSLLNGLRGNQKAIKYDFYSQIAKEKDVIHFFYGLLE